VEGLKTTFHGPRLITHWGLSGPAILKASAWAARILNEQHYKSRVFINWVGEQFNSATWMQAHLFPKHKSGRCAPMEFPHGCGIICWTMPTSFFKALDKLGPKQQQRLIQTITQWEGNITGKTTYKEEFVTAGGIDLKSHLPKDDGVQAISGIIFRWRGVKCRWRNRWI
jgi:predicted flavoprotein YhiN